MRCARVRVRRLAPVVFAALRPRAARHALDNGDREKLYRRALKAAHPDTGGSRESYDRVQAAASSLGLRS